MEQPNPSPAVDGKIIVDFSEYGITFPLAMTMCAFLTIAFYNVIELHGLVFTTFKKWNGLYFWSVLTVVWGLVLNGLATLLETFGYSDGSVASLNIVLVVLLIGWYMMATGQAVVLYSRLYLLVTNPTIIRGVLILICFTSFTFLIPLTIIILMKSNVSEDNPVNNVYKVWEPLQLTVFSLQEMVISGLYIHRTIKILRLRKGFHGTPIRRTLVTLLVTLTFVIALDISLIALQFAGYDTLQHFYKPCVYSIKVKVEFAVLNELVHVMRNRTGTADVSNSGPQYGNQISMKGSKYAAGTANHEGDYNYGVAAGSGPNHIPLTDVHKNSVMKTTEVAVEREGSVYEDTERVGIGRNGSRSSSQVQLAQTSPSSHEPI